MEPKKKRTDGEGAEMRDAVFVRWTATMLSPASPEFQARAKRPLSERGPNLARYHEEERAKTAEQPKPTDNDKPAA